MSTEEKRRAAIDKLLSSGKSKTEICAALGYSSGSQTNIDNFVKGSCRELDAKVESLFAAFPELRSRTKAPSAAPSTPPKAPASEAAPSPPAKSPPTSTTATKVSPASDTKATKKKPDEASLEPSGAPTSPPPRRRPTESTTPFKILYWNHGASDCSALKEFLISKGVKKEGDTTTQLEKFEVCMQKFVLREAPDVVVVAEMKSKEARGGVCALGFEEVTSGVTTDHDEVAMFIRHKLVYEPHHSGTRWLAVNVVKGDRMVRVTGVHLEHKVSSANKAIPYPALEAAYREQVRDFVAIGDWNRDPAANVSSGATALRGAEIDNVLVPDSGVSVELKTLTAKEMPSIALLEKKNPHPAIVVNYV